MLVYLSGPMSGYENYNYEQFNEKAALLREAGFTVINPAETAGGTTELPRKTFMQIDISYVMAADAVVLMKGWGSSPGARLEALVAHELEKPVFRLCECGEVGGLQEIRFTDVQFGLSVERDTINLTRDPVAEAQTRLR